MQIIAVTVMYCALVLVMKDLNCYSNPTTQVSHPYPPFLDKESECGHSHASISLTAAVGQFYFIVTMCHWKAVIKSVDMGAGEMAQLPKIFAAFSEDLGLAPS